MSLIQTFVDAFKKAAGMEPKKPDIDAKEVIRGSGLLGPTDQFRPAPESDTGQGIDQGDVSVGSADPEEGGEDARPTGLGRI